MKFVFVLIIVCFSQRSGSKENAPQIVVNQINRLDQSLSNNLTVSHRTIDSLVSLTGYSPAIIDIDTNGVEYELKQEDIIFWKEWLEQNKNKVFLKGQEKTVFVFLNQKEERSNDPNCFFEECLQISKTSFDKESSLLTNLSVGTVFSNLNREHTPNLLSKLRFVKNSSAQNLPVHQLQHENFLIPHLDSVICGSELKLIPFEIKELHFNHFKAKVIIKMTCSGIERHIRLMKLNGNWKIINYLN